MVSFLFGNVAIAQNTVSGTVYNDLDGSAKGTFSNIQTGTETGTNANGTLNVYVVTLLDIIVAKASVAPDGTYISSPFSSLLTLNVYLVLDTVSRNVGDNIGTYSTIKMPAAWTNTSPYMTADMPTLGADIVNQNFGIQKNGFLTIPDFSLCAASDSLFTWYFRGSRTTLANGTTIVESSGTSAKVPFLKVTARYFTNNVSYSVSPDIYAPANYTVAGAGGGQPIPTTLEYKNPVLEIGGSSAANGINNDSIGISVAFKNTNGQKMYIQKLNNAVLDLDTYESLKVIGYNNGAEVKPVIYVSNGYADNTTNDMRSFYMGNKAWIFDVSSGFQASGPCNAWCDYNYNAVAIMEFPTAVDSIFYTARITEPTGNRGYISTSVGTNEITGFKYCPVTIQGKLWDDANGNGITDGAEINVLNSGYYINLLDEYGKVLATTPILADGTYIFASFPQLATTTNMKLQVSATQGTIGALPPATGVPNGYVSVSENQAGVTPETGALANKEIILPLLLGSNLSSYDFGIEKLPDTDPKIQAVSYPAGGIIPAGTVTNAVSGSDFEDGTLGNSNTIAITNLPANAMMLYNGVAIAAGQQITGFNPALVSFTGITLGSTSVFFNYAFIDAAGKQDPTPAGYTLNWLQPLPVTLEIFTATKENDNVRVMWKTLTEQNLDRFVIEYSKDGRTFTSMATVTATGNSSIPANYSWLHTNAVAGNNYYRLKIIDINERYVYSNLSLIKISNAGGPAITVYPNPVQNILTIVLPRNCNANTMVNVFSSNGKLVYTKTTGNGQSISMPVSELASGVYYVRIAGEKGGTTFLKK
ncbi:hypothetical protein GCM10027043_16740 [Ferruginibacter profundus]